MATKNNSAHTITAILSYLSILCIVPLIVYKKKDDFMKFHIRQGIVLFIVELIFAAIKMMFSWLPFMSLAAGVVSILIFIAIIFAIINGLNGKMWKIPVIREYTRLVNI